MICPGVTILQSTRLKRVLVVSVTPASVSQAPGYTRCESDARCCLTKQLIRPNVYNDPRLMRETVRNRANRRRSGRGVRLG